jgi:hypothetical protein
MLLGDQNTTRRIIPVCQYIGPRDTIACPYCREGRPILWQFMIYLGTMSSCQMQQRMVRWTVNLKRSGTEQARSKLKYCSVTERNNGTPQLLLLASGFEHGAFWTQSMISDRIDCDNWFVELRYELLYECEGLLSTKNGSVSVFRHSDSVQVFCPSRLLCRIYGLSEWFLVFRSNKPIL